RPPSHETRGLHSPPCSKLAAAYQVRINARRRCRSSRCIIIANATIRLPGDRYEPWFGRVLELSMRPALANHRPTIVLQHLMTSRIFTIAQTAWSFTPRLRVSFEQSHCARL